MRYREIPPPPPLRPFLRCLWLAENAEPGGRVERILPDGCLELVVHYGRPMRRLAPNGGPQDQAGALLAGQLRTAMLLEPTGPLGMVGARFQPWAASLFLREASNTLTAQVVALEAVWGREGAELEERIREAASDGARFRLLVEALLARLSRAPELDAGLVAAVRWIDDARGSLPVAELARRLQWSRRRLERRFQAGVGLGPKALCRVRRFQQVVKRLSGETQRRPALATLALDAGYADQAHFAREFKELSGLSATRYLEEQHVLSDSFMAGGQAAP